MPSIHSSKAKKYNTNNKTKTKKNKNNNNQIISSGGGVFSITPKIYTNIQYRENNYKTNELTCIQCKNKIFRHHEALHSSRLRAVVLDSDVFDKKYNIFVCNQCGFMMNYSGNIKYNKTKIEKN
jgi:predicted nucleic-acid-binding Zn-ribbon protein